MSDEEEDKQEQLEVIENKTAKKGEKPWLFKKGNRLGGYHRPPDSMMRLLWNSSDKVTKTVIAALDAEKTVVVPGGKGEPASHFSVADWSIRLQAADLIWCRIYGRPKQEVSGVDGGPIELSSASSVDLKKLSDEELKALQILKSAHDRLLEEGKDENR